MICRAMVQETAQGIPSVYAREMERLSAKESLILAVIYSPKTEIDTFNCNFCPYLARFCSQIAENQVEFEYSILEILRLLKWIHWLLQLRASEIVCFQISLCWSTETNLDLQLNDAGGFEALVTGKITDVQKIDVNERITSLERLNPTPRPTTQLLDSLSLRFFKFQEAICMNN